MEEDLSREPFLLLEPTERRGSGERGWDEGGCWSPEDEDEGGCVLEEGWKREERRAWVSCLQLERRDAEEEGWREDADAGVGVAAAAGEG